MSLQKTAVMNLSMLSVVQIVGLLISQIGLIVLARILTKDDYGLYAIVLVVYNLFQLISMFGLDLGAIQSKENLDDVLSSSLALRCIGTAISAVILIPLSFIIAGFFNIPNLILPIQTIIISLLIALIGFGPLVMLYKDLRFLSISISRFVFSITWVITAIILAIKGFGYWSLLISLIIGNIASNVVLFYYQKRIVRPRIVKHVSRNLIRFGKYQFISSILVLLVLSLDKVAIGKLLSPSLLGAYFIAFGWGTMMSSMLSNAIGGVMFPTYVRLSNDPGLMKKAFTKTLIYTGYLSFPIGFGIAAISSVFVGAFLGINWAAAIIPLSILAFVGITQSMVAPSWSVFMSIGKPSIETKQIAIAFIPFIILLVPITQSFGIIGVSFLILATCMIWTLMGISRSIKLLGIRTHEIVIGLAKPIVASSIMAIMVFLSSCLVPQNLVSFVILVIQGIGIYFIAIHLLTKGEALREGRVLFSAIIKR